VPRTALEFNDECRIGSMIDEKEKEVRNDDSNSG
jgi:hypothetical protein